VLPVPLKRVPELAQVGVGERIAVIGAGEAVGEREAAAPRPSTRPIDSVY